MKVIIGKQTAESEQLQVEVTGNAQLVERELPIAYQIIDERVWQQNQRMLAVQARLRTLAKTSPAAYKIVVESYEILSGRRLPEPQDRPPHTIEEALARAAREEPTGEPVPESGVTA